MKLDYLFIGAGPANLAAANYLLEHGINNILILEAGNSFGERFCPGYSSKNCIHCSRSSCQNIAGEGGSSAIYGNKLCYLPASSGLLKYFPETILSKSNRYLDDILNPFYESKLNGYKSNNDCRKTYSSEILPKYLYKEFISKLLIRPKYFNILLPNSKAIEIIPQKDNNFKIITDTGLSLETKTLILGCGRTSHSFLRKTFNKLGILYEENSPDLGIRIEAPSSYFSEEFIYQVDPKYKINISNIGSSRTFCTCTGGLIIPVRYGDSYYADGVFGDNDTEVSNLAFMARAIKPISAEKLESWCTSVNKSSQNGLYLGTAAIGTHDHIQLADRIVSLVPHWPTNDHKYLLTELLKITLIKLSSIANMDNNNSHELRVYGPAIDLYWPKPILSQGFRTSLPNLFILGDAIGISRGIVQALISGVAWAISQYAYTNKHEYKTTKLIFDDDLSRWSVSA